MHRCRLLALYLLPLLAICVASTRALSPIGTAQALTAGEKLVVFSGNKAIPYVYNLTQTSLPKTRAMLARVKAGGGRGRILGVGDSTTYGYGSLAGGAPGPGLLLASYPYDVAGSLVSAGIPTSTESFFGDGGAGATNLPIYDSRIAVGSFTFSSPNSIGGGSFNATAATASPWSFTPTVPTNTCELVYLKNGALGTFNINANGGSNTSVNSSGAAAVGNTAFSASLGSNVYNVTRNAGTVFGSGMICYDSTVKAVDILNAGWGSSKTGDWVSIWQGFQGFSTAVTADLVIISLGINDFNSAVGSSTYQTNLASLVAGAQASGADVIMIAPVSSGGSLASQPPYMAAARAVADAAGVPYFDINAKWGGFAAANAQGFMNSDQIHPTAAGYRNIAQTVTQIILSRR